ncbi:MAG TPA: lysine--tRNA ligase [Patescibacteria group bacterium]|nr:lysine--tRNA ligase [Patescibacteria group bacterium]
MDEVRIRKEKLLGLQKQGIDPYPKDAEQEFTCADLLNQFEAFAQEKREIKILGRVLTTRVHGSMIFADLTDASGKIQLVFKEDEIGTDSFALFRDFVDPGDFLEAQGTLFTTKRGEKSIAMSAWRLLAKALRPLPEKWHGLKDVEARFRERELDLLSNPEVRRRFIVRSKLVSSMRKFLDEQGFMEVETPVFHPIPGGANARPFITHHNALGVDFYLRIAPELYLKRLLVGGFERIYEVARCFRNEGIDPTHNPEFTQIELYWAYAGKDRFFRFLEEMLTTLVHETLGSLKIQHGDEVIDFTAPWPRQSFRDVLFEASGIDINKLKSPKDVIAAAKKTGKELDFSHCVGMGEYFDELYKKLARPQIKGPIWITEYPVEMKPLANQDPNDPTKSATAQLLVHGAEIINAFYYELNDPLDQRKRFKEQAALAEKGSEEAQRMDEGFLTALEHGMPPASGMGMGIDRLTALLTDAPNLKEVILFPTLRPEN